MRTRLFLVAALVPGLDRVPGKSVPRVVREQISVTAAMRQALALLTSGQRGRAVELLRGLHA